MAVTQAKAVEGIAPLVRTAAPTQRKARPVLWWAGLGAVFVLIYAYTFVRFLVDIPANVSAGPSHVPAYMWWNSHFQEVLFPTLLCLVFYKFIFRPLFRRQKIPWDGVAAAAFPTLMWQNYGIDWFGWVSGYNAVLINRGSWYEHVPFWLAPNAKNGFAEAYLWDTGFYGFWILLLVFFCFVMRAIKRRWPQMGNAGVFLSIFGVTMALDIAAEVIWLRGGAYHYGGAIKGLTLFYGHYYQYPLYEGLLFGGCLALMAAVRFFKNDKGESIAERGIEEVNVSSRTKTWIRWLAMCGIFNFIFFLYNASFTPFALHSSEWPQDIQKRSYFTQGICGAKTDRACPGPGVPVGRPGSAYLTPDGKMAHPPGDDWDGPPSPQVPFVR